MKKVWFGIGAFVIIILLLLQTRFTEFLRLDNSGYAVESGSVKQLLLANPEDEAIEETDIAYYPFEALDYIYKRGKSYYLGEKKKTEIDLNFPFLINDCAGIMFIDNESILFDVEFEEYQTYRGLMMSDKVAYNPGGERADANEYLFAQISNGLYINLTPFSYEAAGEVREVTMNSFICFRENYFTYMEPVNGTGIYQRCNRIANDDSVFIDGEEYSYQELLLLLRVLSNRKEPEIVPPAEEEIPLPEQEVLETQEEATTLPEIAVGDEEEDDEDEEDTPSSSPNRPSRPASRPSGSQNPSGGEDDSDYDSGSNSGGGGGTGERPEGSRGERPDSARPDLGGDDEDDREEVENYVKPIVTVIDIIPGVYRIRLDVDVVDPANRLNTLRKVQFEFYEVENDGSETLVYRTYTGSSKMVEAGNGVIKPDTRYRINAYFTYYNEYNESVVESILLPDDGYVTTNGRDTLGKVVFQTGFVDGVAYMDIPYYYDNKLVITGVAYDPALSDPEAVYAIDNGAGGMTIHITGVSNSTFSTDSRVENTVVAKIKQGIVTEVSSVPTLRPNSSYQYELQAKDFGGYSIELENHTGTFETCKSRPLGTLTIENNKISSFKIKATMTDPDASAIPVQGGTDYQTYLVIATGKYDTANGFTWEDCQAYIDNGYTRVAADEANGVEEGKVHYLYLFTQEELLNDDGEIDLSEVLEATTLDLNQKYYAYLIGDFDLNNRRGPQIKEEIASLPFTSASLSSLGSIYVKVDIADVDAHSAVITFTLNDSKTNDVLRELLSDVTFDIVPVGGENAHASITFNEEAVQIFKEGISDGHGGLVRSVVMHSDYFDAEQGGTPLMSKTEYEIVPTIKATYNNRKYDMNVVLTNSKFKTLRERPQVLIQNDIFAAGTLRFDVRIDDPDEAITGNSGHVVVMNIYDYNRNFIKAVRIPKNTEDYLHQEITGLDSSKRYFINFVAVEYNEGYTNASFKSNEVIYTHYIDSALNISGQLKLQGIDLTSPSSKLIANTQVTISDTDRILNGEMPYYISIQKDGVDVTDSYDRALTEITNYVYGAGNVIKQDLPFMIDKSDAVYVMTLYIMYNNNRLVLDTLTFSAEDMVIGISTAQEFVEIMKRSGGKGRYVITDDIDLGTSGTVYTVDGKEVKPSGLVSNFNGQIDFQGYELTINKVGDGAGIFSNLGPRAEIFNAVFNFKSENGTRVYDNGVLCDYNYGHIHDVIVNYDGGSSVANQYYGLLCRFNTSSGIIERFVVHNDPEEGLFPFAAQYQCGLVASANKGVIRDGYVYGEDIFAATTASNGGDMNIGGIVGYNDYVGQLENVFSLVNVIVPPPQETLNGAVKKAYGAVAGNALGSIKNVYSIGQSTYTSIDTENHEIYDSDGIGPALGGNNSANRNVYYWNDREISYPNGKYQTLVSLESLHDYNWQSAILGDAFDVQPVEVGYYPQVIMSEELPEQEFIPLPQRSYANLVELMSAMVLSYAEDGNSAEVEFRFSNTRNAWIDELTIDGLTVALDYDSVESLDGYTTIRGTVSQPTKFVSSYEITGVKCQLGNRVQNITFDPKPLLMVDFYRDIHNADEWYQYVVQKPTENARLACDIDFAGVRPASIRVTKNFTGKLSGGKKEGCTYGYSLKNIDFSAETNSYIFAALYGEMKGVCIEELKIGTNRTARHDVTAFVKNLYGTVENVHLKNVSLAGTEYMGSLVGYARSGSVIQDCSANNVSIVYKETPNTNTTAYVGGLVGYLYYSRLENCYVRNVDINANDLRASQGIGGVIGRAESAMIDSAYATGDITARAMNVGGIVGQYAANRSGLNAKNLIARVNVTCNQNAVGGLVGQMRVSESPLTEQTNVTGIAFGNVFCSNTDSQEVSYTIGYLSGYRATFYGTDFQLINGIVGAEKDKNTCALLTYEQATTPSVYTDNSLLNMESCYDYSKAAQGYIPTLYYADGSAQLPFQEDNLPISLVTDNLIEITAIGVNEASNQIWMDVEGPEGYTILGVEIEDLVYEIFNTPTIDATGNARVVVRYANEVDQEHFLDSYNLTKLSYRVEATSEQGVADYSYNPIRVPLTLFKDIYDIATWNMAFDESNNNGNYENYRIKRNIDFSTGEVYATNAKVGRLVGSVAENLDQRANLTNIRITKNNENLIFRLNSEMSAINFKDCSVETAGRDNIGLVGTSAARVYDMSFENITVEDKNGSRNYIGIIGYQQGGCIGEYDEEAPEKGKVTLKNITVGQRKGNNSYVGAMAGYACSETLFTNIEAEGINVRGKTYIGGIVGGAAKISMDRVEAKDVTAISTGAGRVGGILGSGSTGHTSVNSARMTNITLTGTPVYDAEGNIVSSTTTIGIDEAKANVDAIYVGGIFGYLENWGTGFSGSSVNNKEPIHADGIVVQGYGNYVGGIGGYLYAINNATIENSLITTVKTPTRTMTYFGGIGGRTNYNNYYNMVVNCQVKPTNFSYVGLVSGYQYSSSMYYAQAEDSSLIAKNTLTQEMKYYGGIVGYNAASTLYSTVYNCTVDASDGNMAVVGGVVGHTQASVDRCFYYAEPKVKEGANAAPTPDVTQYYVRGRNLVGGLAGENYYASGSITKSYSNANVIATENYAGGLLGAYENGYVSTTLNSSPRYTYAACYLTNCYFAGTVEANDYAGGLIGRLGMKYKEGVAASHRELGGRNSSTSIAGGKSGSNNETTYTAYNLMLAESVTANGGNAYAFAGNYDGFEGKANTAGASIDASSADKAKFTYLYAGTKLNNVQLYDMLNTGAPNHAKNSGSYRYKLFDGYNTGGTNSIADAGSANKANVRLVLPENLSNAEQIGSGSAEAVGDYRAMKWYMDYQIGRGRRAWGDMRGDYYRMITADVKYTDSYAKLSAADTAFYQGKSYLPHVRLNNGANAISDWLTKYQSSKQIALPVPNGSFAARVETLSFNTMSMRMNSRAVSTYAMIYPSDVDKINVEFSGDLLAGGYFILYRGDEIVDKQLITKRVYSYSYDYKEDLKLSYGYAQHSSLEEENLTETDSLHYDNRSLERHVMTYGNKYYYIDEQGIWSGTGSTAAEGAVADADSREDASAQLRAGEFITLYNGKALRADGAIINVESGEQLGSVAGGCSYLGAQAIPLQVFRPEGAGDVLVESYSRFCEIISDGIVVREAQYVQSALGMENIIDGSVPNVKDSVVLYQKDDFMHCTILGRDGIMFDMYSGDELNAPEDFRTSGIVYMTNNFNSTAPFILVEYQNGGIAGYNYMTGKYLFDHSTTNVMSLLDYARVYFDEDRSELSNIPATYASNAQLAQIAGTSDRLSSMISGVSEGVDDGNNTGDADTLETQNPDTATRAENGTTTSNIADASDYERFEEGTEEQEAAVPENNQDSTNNPEPAITGSPSVADDEEVNTLATEGNTTGNDEIPVASVEGSTQLNGAGAGDGAIEAQGTTAAAGTEVGAGNGTGNGIGTGMGTGVGTDEGETGRVDSASASEVNNETSGDNDSEVDASEDEDSNSTHSHTSDTATSEGQDEEESQSHTSNKNTVSEVTIVSTAGTELTVPATTLGINNGDGQSDAAVSAESGSEEGTAGTGESELITVYNQFTGTYEIVDRRQFFTNQYYYSENQRLNVVNLSSVYTGVTMEEPEQKQANGLGLYIFISLCALGGIGGTIWYRKKHKMKF